MAALCHPPAATVTTPPRDSDLDNLRRVPVPRLTEAQLAVIAAAPREHPTVRLQRQRVNIPAASVATSRIPGTISGALAGSFCDPTVIPHWYTSPLGSVTANVFIPPHATSRTRIPESRRGNGHVERDMDEIVSMSAGVDTSLSVFVSAPRVDASVAGDGRGVPAPQGGEFDARVGRRFRLGGEGRDAARGLHPLLFRVEAEGIVRVPAPGVQRAPLRATTAELRLPARMGLVGCVESRRATRSPSGRASAVGVGTDQSSAHLLEVTGAKSRPS